MFPENCGTRVRRILNLIGVFLIHLPSRPLLYFGNLAVYVPSYVLLHSGHLTTDIDQLKENNKTLNTSLLTLSTNVSEQTPHHLVSEHSIQESWFVPVFSTAWMVGVFLSGVIAHYIRARFVIGFGIIFQSGSLFLSYYTINISESAFFVTLCIFIGFGAGLYEGLLLKNYVVLRLNKRTATVTSLVLSSGPLGGVIINQFITWYTNPDNLSPDLKMGEMRFFSQESIQERIPSMFLILGSTMLCLTTIGYFMLKEQKKVNAVVGESYKSDTVGQSSLDDNDSCPFEKEESKNSSHNYIVTHDKTDDSSDVHLVSENDNIGIKINKGVMDKSKSMSNEYDDNSEIDEHIKHHGITDNETFEDDSEDLRATLYTQEYYETDIRISKDNLHNPIIKMSPLQLLKSLDFYKLAIVYIFGSSARLFLSVYYKVYGQEWIQDDHFLTNLATAMSFLAIFTTVLWGFVLDRIGLKLCFIVIYTGIAVFFVLMYFCAQLDKWAYFFVTLSNSSFVNYLYPIFTIAIIKWFGKNHLSSKLGIVEIFSTIGYVLATFVLAGLMEAYGYLSGFIWTSSVHVVGLIIIIASFPKF